MVAFVRIAALASVSLLAACATTPQPFAATCDAGRVTVTSQGTRLALRPSTTARLQRASAPVAGGRVVLSCRPSAGTLKGCAVLYEDAPGEGFGRAALAWSDRIIYPSDEEARSVEVVVRFDPADARRCGPASRRA